ncbi:MAG: hypothetical protein ACREE9_12840 [Stellaceae bacterium]
MDSITGTHLYRHADLVTGGSTFPYALPFAHDYSSASNLADLGLGNGWTDGYSIAAQRSSDPYRGVGEAAPAAIAATADMGEKLGDRCRRRDRRPLCLAGPAERQRKRQAADRGVDRRALADRSADQQRGHGVVAGDQRGIHFSAARR